MGNSSDTVPATFAGGRYKIERLLGEGASKRVYLAHDSRLERDVAFALVKTEGLDADGQTRVRREAGAMGQLGEHPNIINIYDIGEDAGRLFIVSQYVSGALSKISSAEPTAIACPRRRHFVSQTRSVRRWRMHTATESSTAISNPAICSLPQMAM